MAVESTVRWFTSEMVGAPALSGLPGSLIEILDACLLNGFGTATPDGDKITVSGGVATMHFSGGNPFEKHVTIKIEGAIPAELNDLWRVKSSTATTCTFDCPGIADGAASGNITAMFAPAGGWEKPFVDVNLAAYRSGASGATGHFFRIDDSEDKFSRWRGFEQMTGIDNGVNPFPTEAQVAGTGLLWPRSNSADSDPRKWRLFADDRHVYFFPAAISNYSDSYEAYYFGDFVSLSETDTANSCLHGSKANLYTYPANNGFENTKITGCRWMPRNSSGDYASVAHFISAKTDLLGNGNSGDYPQPGGGVVFDYPVMVRDGQNVNGNVRGYLPGLLSAMHTCLPLDGQVLEGVGADSIPIFIFATNSGWAKFSIAFDIQGPWR